MDFRVSNFVNYIQERDKRIYHWAKDNLFAEYNYYNEKEEAWKFDKPNRPINLDWQDVDYLYHFAPPQWPDALSARYNQLIFDYDVYVKQNYIISQLEKRLGNVQSWKPHDEQWRQRLSEAIAEANSSHLSSTPLSGWASDRKNTKGKRDFDIFCQPITLVDTLRKGESEKPFDIERDEKGNIYKDGQERWSVTMAYYNTLFYNLLKQFGFDPAVWSIVRIGEGQSTKLHDMENQSWYFVKSHIGHLHSKLTKSVNSSAIAHDASLGKRNEYKYKTKDGQKVTNQHGLDEINHGTYGFNLSQAAAYYHDKKRNKRGELIQDPESLANEYGTVERTGSAFIGMMPTAASQLLHRLQESIRDNWYFTDEQLGPDNKPVRVMFNPNTKKFLSKDNTWGDLQQAQLNPLASLQTPGTELISIENAKLRMGHYQSNSEYQRLLNTVQKQNYKVLRPGEEGHISTPTRGRTVAAHGLNPSFLGFGTTDPQQLQPEYSKDKQSTEKDSKRPYLILGTESLEDLNKKINEGREQAIKAYFSALDEWTRQYKSQFVSLNPVDPLARRFVFKPLGEQADTIAKQMLYSVDLSHGQRVIPRLRFELTQGSPTLRVISKSTTMKKEPIPTPFLTPSATIDRKANRKWSDYNEFANYFEELLSPNEDVEGQQEIFKHVKNLLLNRDGKDLLEQFIKSTEQMVVSGGSVNTKRKWKQTEDVLKRLRDFRTQYIDPYKRSLALQGHSIDNPKIYRMIDQDIKQLLRDYISNCREIARKSQLESPLYDDYDWMRNDVGNEVESFRKHILGKGTLKTLGDDKQAIGGKDPKIWNELLKEFFGYQPAADALPSDPFTHARYEESLSGNGKHTTEFDKVYPVRHYTDGPVSDQELYDEIQLLKNQAEEAKTSQDFQRAKALQNKISFIKRFSVKALDEELRQFSSDQLPQQNQKLLQLMRKLLTAYSTAIANYIRPRIKINTELSQVSDEAKADYAYKKLVILKKAESQLVQSMANSLQDTRDAFEESIQFYEQAVQLLEQQGQKDQIAYFRSLIKQADEHNKDFEKKYLMITHGKMPEAIKRQPPKPVRSKKTVKESIAFTSSCLYLEEDANVHGDVTQEEKDFLKSLHALEKEFEEQKKACAVTRDKFLTSLRQRTSRADGNDYFDGLKEINDGPMIREIKNQLRSKLEGTEESCQNLEARALYENLDLLVAACEEHIINNLGHSAFVNYVKAYENKCKKCNGTGKITKNGQQLRCDECDGISRGRKLLRAGGDVWSKIANLTRSFVSSVMQQDFGCGSRRKRNKATELPDVSGTLQSLNESVTHFISGYTQSSVESRNASYAKLQTELDSIIDNLKQVAEAAKKVIINEHQEAREDGLNAAKNIDADKMSDDIAITPTFKMTIQVAAEKLQLIQFWMEYFKRLGYGDKEAADIATYIRVDSRFNPYFTTVEKLEQFKKMLAEQMSSPAEANPGQIWRQIMGSGKHDPVTFRRNTIVQIMKAAAGHDEPDSSDSRKTIFVPGKVPMVQGLTYFPSRSESSQSQEHPYAYHLLLQWQDVYKAIMEAKEAEKNNDTKTLATKLQALKDTAKQLQNLQSESTKSLEEIGHSKQKTDINAHRDISVRMIADYIISAIHNHFFTQSNMPNPNFYQFTQEETRIGQKTSYWPVLRTLPEEYVGSIISTEENKDQNRIWLNYLTKYYDSFVKTIYRCPLYRAEMRTICSSGKFYWKVPGRNIQFLYTVSNEVRSLIRQAFQDAQTKFEGGLAYNPGGPQSCKFSFICNHKYTTADGKNTMCPYWNPRQKPDAGDPPRQDWGRNTFAGTIMRAQTNFQAARYPTPAPQNMPQQ